MNILRKLIKVPGWLMKNRFLLLNRWRFKEVGKRVSIFSPLHINGMEYITLGNRVSVHEGTWLAATPLTGHEVRLVIEDEAVLGHYNHIFATKSIIIEKYVLTANQVYISDNLHSYEDVSLPVIRQPIKQCNTVVIGEGSWLGENVCVIGASVGKHCVIGANSVVTKDIPDYSVAVGAPARVIKTYDSKKEEWIKI